MAKGKRGPHLYQERNSYWYIYFTRRLIRSTKTRNKELAKRIFKIKLKEYRDRNVLALSNRSILLSEFHKEYMENARVEKAESTCIRDDYSFRILREIIGNPLLKLITPQKVRHFRNVLIDTGRTKAGTNITIRHLKSAFQTAVGRYISSNPFMQKKLLFKVEPRVRFLKAEEISQILGAIRDPDFSDLLQVYLLSGIRRSGVALMCCKEVNFESNLVYVVHSKTEPYWEPMHPIVRRILERRTEKIRVGQIFPKWKPDSITHKFAKLVEKLGIDCRLHDLRHSFASYLAMSGESIEVIKELLGLKQISTALRYSHFSKEHLQKAILNLKMPGLLIGICP